MALDDVAEGVALAAVVLDLHREQGVLERVGEPLRSVVRARLGALAAMSEADRVTSLRASAGRIGEGSDTRLDLDMNVRVRALVIAGATRDAGVAHQVAQTTRAGFEAPSGLRKTVQRALAPRQTSREG